MPGRACVGHDGHLVSDVPIFINDTDYEQVRDLVELLADQARAALQSQDGHGHIAILSSTIQEARTTGLPVTEAASNLDPGGDDLLITLAERILALLATADREFPDRVGRLEALLHDTLTSSNR
jgi:hypothetical protein